MFNGTPLIPLIGGKRLNPESPLKIDMTLDSPRSMTNISNGGSVSLASFDSTVRKRHAATQEKFDIELGLMSEMEANPQPPVYHNSWHMYLFKIISSFNYRHLTAQVKYAAL